MWSSFEINWGRFHLHSSTLLVDIYIYIFFYGDRNIIKCDSFCLNRSIHFSIPFKRQEPHKILNFQWIIVWTLRTDNKAGFFWQSINLILFKKCLQTRRLFFLNEKQSCGVDLLNITEHFFTIKKPFFHRMDSETSAR